MDDSTFTMASLWTEFTQRTPSYRDDDYQRRQFIIIIWSCVHVDVHVHVHADSIGVYQGMNISLGSVFPKRGNHFFASHDY